MYSGHNEGKSLVAERFIRNLKTKIYKHITAVSKNMYTDKFNDKINKYNNIYHRKIKMKPVNIKDNTYIDFLKEFHQKDSKFRIRDHVRISKYKKNFAKGYTPNWLPQITPSFCD